MRTTDLSEIHKNSRMLEIELKTIREYSCGMYVEVGTLYGASACVAAEQADNVFTIDIFDWQPKLFKDDDKITFYKGTSVDFVNKLKAEGKEQVIDLLFIDGAHEYEYTLMDCESLCPHVKTGGYVFFHDYNPMNPTTRVFDAVNAYLDKMPHKKLPKLDGSNMLMVEKL